MIPRDFKQTPDGDWDLSLGLRRTDTLTEFVTLKIPEALNFYAGEWFLDTRKGVPYFEYIWGQRPDLGLVQTIYRKALTAITGVDTVVSLVVTFDAPERAIRVTAAVRLVSGDEIEFKDLIIRDLGSG